MTRTTLGCSSQTTGASNCSGAGVMAMRCLVGRTRHSVSRGGLVGGWLLTTQATLVLVLQQNTRKNTHEHAHTHARTRANDPIHARSCVAYACASQLDDCKVTVVWPLQRGPADCCVRAHHAVHRARHVGTAPRSWFRDVNQRWQLRRLCCRQRQPRRHQCSLRHHPATVHVGG